MKIEMRPTASLIPYQGNPRRNDKAVDAVARSIKEFGFRQPIVLDKAGVVIVGHTRLKAALKLGLEQVPVHVADGLTPEQIRAYRIADNQIASIAEWDEPLLKVEIGELAALDFDLGVLGFPDADIERLLCAFGVGEADLPELASGDRAPFQQMTFTLSDAQADAVKQACARAKAQGDFIDTGNENSNGNALARIAEAYLGQC